MDNIGVIVVLYVVVWTLGGTVWVDTKPSSQTSTVFDSFFILCVTCSPFVCLFVLVFRRRRNVVMPHQSYFTLLHLILTYSLKTYRTRDTDTSHTLIRYSYSLISYLNSTHGTTHPHLAPRRIQLERYFRA